MASKDITPRVYLEMVKENSHQTECTNFVNYFALSTEMTDYFVEGLTDEKKLELESLLTIQKVSSAEIEQRFGVIEQTSSPFFYIYFDKHQAAPGGKFGPFTLLEPGVIGFGVRLRIHGNKPLYLAIRRILEQKQEQSNHKWLCKDDLGAVMVIFPESAHLFGKNLDGYLFQIHPVKVDHALVPKDPVPDRKRASVAIAPAPLPSPLHPSKKQCVVHRR